MPDKGRGWHGETDRHAKAAKKAGEGRFKSATRTVGGAVRTVGHGAVMLAKLPLRGAHALGMQARGTARNAGRAWDYLTFDNLLPPGVRDLIQFVIETIPRLFGLRGAKPWHQVAASVTLIGAAILGTALTGGALIGAVVVVAGFGTIGLARFIPAVNENWNDLTALLPVKRDYDVPRWKRD